MIRECRDYFSITDPDPDPEQELTDRAWRTYVPPALRFATLLVGPDDAHDIATRAFLRVTNSTGWVSLDQPQSDLFRAVSSEAHTHQRQGSRRWRRDLNAITAHDAIDNPVDAYRYAWFVDRYIQPGIVMLEHTPPPCSRCCDDRLNPPCTPRSE